MSSARFSCVRSTSRSVLAQVITSVDCHPRHEHFGLCRWRVRTLCLVQRLESTFVSDLPWPNGVLPKRDLGLFALQMFLQGGVLRVCGLPHSARGMWCRFFGVVCSAVLLKGWRLPGRGLVVGLRDLGSRTVGGVGGVRARGLGELA